MRIIAGSLKGRRLQTPTWDGLRPTSDKLRETLFNILAPRVAGARVLDAYAGTGALGLEALSRGAASVTLVERDPRAQRLIADNVARCGAAEGCVIIRASVARALETLRDQPPFDIVLLDPPYGTSVPGRTVGDDLDRVLDAAGHRLAPGGVLVLEHARKRPAPETTDGLVRVRAVTSGDSALALYERKK